VEVDVESKDVLDEDVDDAVGFEDAFDCDVDIMKAVVATIKTKVTITAVNVAPIPLRSGIKAIRPSWSVL
jgi:hypothetical protein